MQLLWHNSYAHVDQIKQLFSYTGFSTAGSTEREKEQSVYMYFMDLLHECEGTILSMYNVPHYTVKKQNCAS